MLKDSRSDRRAAAPLKPEHLGQERISNSMNLPARFAQLSGLEIQPLSRHGFRWAWAALNPEFVEVSSWKWWIR